MPSYWDSAFVVLTVFCEICNGYIKLHMQKINKLIAPNHITELSECEIFVFGSNLEGQHDGGAARLAYESLVQSGAME